MTAASLVNKYPTFRTKIFAFILKGLIAQKNVNLPERALQEPDKCCRTGFYKMTIQKVKLIFFSFSR
jgi:hypothetical protein